MSLTTSIAPNICLFHFILKLSIWWKWCVTASFWYSMFSAAMYGSSLAEEQAVQWASFPTVRSVDLNELTAAAEGLVQVCAMLGSQLQRQSLCSGHGLICFRFIWPSKWHHLIMKSQNSFDRKMQGCNFICILGKLIKTWWVVPFKQPHLTFLCFLLCSTGG